MSPLPLIERQRALTRIGEIRCGDEKPATGNRPGARLDTFRLTSQHKEILERAAQLYGGTIKPWKSPTGDAWQVITTTNALPVMVIPDYSLRRQYELWEGPSKRVRMCDGEEEFITGGPCICNANRKDECKLLTRLMVLLPETGTSLGWQVSSTGETAADELDLAMLLAKGIAQGRTFVPARLRLTQRRGQLNGQATRFVVPVLDLDPAEHRNLGRDTPALPPGYTPIERNPEEPLSLEEGLRVAEAQVLAKPPRVQLPDDDVDDLGTEPALGVIQPPLAGSPHGDEAVAAKSVPEQLGAEPASPAGSPGGGETAALVESAPTIRQREGLERAATAVGERRTPEEVAADTDRIRGNTIARSTQDKPITAAQAKKLDVLVGQLRDNGHIQTEHLYVKVARLRNVDIDTMIALTPNAYTEEPAHPILAEEGMTATFTPTVQVLHWAPLRATLTRGEANQLIDALEEYAGKVGT